MGSRFLLALCLTTGCATQRITSAPPALAAVRVECQQLVAGGKMPSLAIAVAQNGRVVWHEAFGKADIENNRDATVDTMYTLASTGKSITGTAIAILAERGLIDLDSPAQRYLSPEHL